MHLQDSFCEAANLFFCEAATVTVSITVTTSQLTAARPPAFAAVTCPGTAQPV